MLQGVEAEPKRDVRDRAARRAQHLLSLLDAAFDLEADGRKTGRLSELVDEVRGGKRRLAREGVDREGTFRTY